jgi:hypothetical protein
MRSLFSAAIAVFVFWRYDGPQFNDVLEVSTNLVQWLELPGPYVITNGECRAEFQGPASAFFRVKRSWQ